MSNPRINLLVFDPISSTGRQIMFNHQIVNVTLDFSEVSLSHRSFCSHLLALCRQILLQRRVYVIYLVDRPAGKNGFAGTFAPAPALACAMLIRTFARTFIHFLN